MRKFANWTGASGASYRFELYPIGTEFNPKIGESLPEGVTSGMLAQNQLVRRPANVASFARNSSGSHTTCVVPLRQGLLS